MTISDFSSGFDTLLNSYASRALFGDDASKGEIHLDEYEKSFFLTKAQEEIILSIYSGKNITGESFESTEEMRRYLSVLVNETTSEPITTTSGLPLGIDSSSKFFTLPEDLWFITYESVVISNEGSCNDGSTLEVIPVSQDEYHRIKKNPFRGANKRRALRLDLADGVIEIVCKYTVTSYYARYIRKAAPIILVDLSDTDLSINGVNEIIDEDMPCELHEALHQRILERAVEIAIKSKIGSTRE